jgi:hypothetical protein
MVMLLRYSVQWMVIMEQVQYIILHQKKQEYGVVVYCTRDAQETLAERGYSKGHQY